MAIGRTVVTSSGDLEFVSQIPWDDEERRLNEELPKHDVSKDRTFSEEALPSIPTFMSCLPPAPLSKAQKKAKAKAS